MRPSLFSLLCVGVLALSGSLSMVGVSAQPDSPAASSPSGDTGAVGAGGAVPATPTVPATLPSSDSTGADNNVDSTTGIGFFDPLLGFDAANAAILINSAPVPQYWITDASIFIQTAMNMVQGMLVEAQLNVIDPAVTGNQARFTTNSIGRAQSDLNDLLQNALDANPSAVAPLVNSIAYLTAASAQAHRASQVSNTGQLGPTYKVTLRSALNFLNEVSGELQTVATNYDATQYLVSTNAGGSGGAGGAGASCVCGGA